MNKYYLLIAVLLLAGCSSENWLVIDNYIYVNNSTSTQNAFLNVSVINASSITNPTRMSIGADIINFSTPDMSLKLYAKDHEFFGNDNGETIELWAQKPESKPYIGWYAYDPYSNDYEASGWIGCHYNGSAGNIHQHCSWEVSDNSTGTPSVNTAFEISYGRNQTRPNIRFPGSDVQFLSEQWLYFGDNFNQAAITHNGTTGDLELKTNADVNLQASKLDLNGADIVEVDDIFSVSSGSVDIKADTTVNLYPGSQTTSALRVTGSAGTLSLQATGTSILNILEELFITGVSNDGTGKVVCVKADKNLGTCTDAPGASGTCTCV